MEFLKAFFENGAALTFEQLEAKVKEAKMNVVNIADGSYVSKAKFDDKTGSLSQQVSDLQKQIETRDTDIKDLQTKLASAQGDQNKLSELQTKLTDLQSKYDTEKSDWTAKAEAQAYSFLVKEKANGIKFTSNAAKRDFTREVIEKKFKVDGENLLGLEDFITKYKADNPGAIEEEKQDPDNGGGKQPQFVAPKTNPNGAPADPKNAFGFHFNGVRPMPKE